MSFHYEKIVFGIKQHYQINDVLQIFKQQRRYSMLICQHNALDEDYCCDRLNVHYHGVVEFIIGEFNIENFLMELSPYCQYINETRCSAPVEYLAYITLPPKRLIFQEVHDSSKLVELLQTANSRQLEIVRRKKEKRMAYIERDTDITNLVDFCLKAGCNNNNILARLNKNELLLSLLQKKHHKPVIETALNVARKIVLNNSILTLSERLEMSDDYFSPEESARFVKDWCSFQKLDAKEFTRNLIRCLDKKSGNRNSIYLQGARNSGKTYIVQSIIDACIHVGHVRVESTAYPFVWEKCVDKRLIVMHEPHFALKNFDQLDKILSGAGTVIFKHNEVIDYLQPTPVIILANDPEWTDNSGLCEKVKKRFICCNMNLKTFGSPNKKLHPQWLNILNKTLSGRSTLQNNPVMNEGIKEDESNGDRNAAGHSSMTNGDSDFLTEQFSISNEKDSGNLETVRKSPMRDNGNDEGRNKKRCWM